MRLAYAIAHAAWAPGRDASMRRLAAQLPPGTIVLASADREPAREWATRAWRVAADLTRADGVVLLNDDVTVCPDFARACEIVFGDALGPVSLHCQWPDARPLAAAGHRWARSYAYTGPGVILSPSDFASLADFAEAHPWLWESQNEDGVANIWAYARQRPFWLTLPALVQHDTSIRSTLGYDHHPMRTSSVPWTDFSLPDSARVADGPDWPVPTFLENSWMTNDALESIRTRLDLACCFCDRVGRTIVGSRVTGSALCRDCITGIMSLGIGRIEAS